MGWLEWLKKEPNNQDKIIYYVNGGLLIASKQSYICAFIFVAFCLFIALIIYMFSNEEKITQE